MLPDIELFENKLSGAVAAAAFVPLITLGMDTFDEPAAKASATIFHTGTFPFLAMIHFSSAIICVPFAIAAFLIIWLASHAINVLIMAATFQSLLSGWDFQKFAMESSLAV